RRFFFGNNGLLEQRLSVRSHLWFLIAIGVDFLPGRNLLFKTLDLVLELGIAFLQLLNCALKFFETLGFGIALRADRCRAERQESRDDGRQGLRNHARDTEPAALIRQSDYRFGFGETFGGADGAIGGVAVTETVGAVLAAGTTGAPGAGTAGAFGFAGAGDAGSGAALCCFNNSCRNPLSPLPLFA